MVTTFEGQVIEGGSVSLTVTVNEQEPLLPAASVAEQVTVVVPFGKVEPDAGEQVTVPTPGQLSVDSGVAKLTTVEQPPSSVLCVMFDGHVMVGDCASFTVTVNEH